ncbi:hypothetical protein LBMAG42_18870 [Deltaproteobacteria bacterium]|nr:hypothetical protein LBMAG42_18870 [Deltaproteobacteria bacterium]
MSAKVLPAHVTAFNDSLTHLGFDGDPECVGTASRWLSVLEAYRPGQPIPAFETFVAPSCDEVRLRRLPFHSLCAHHLLPFFGEAEIVYGSVGRIAGLGAIARALQHFSRQPQLQERLGAQLADYLHAQLGGPVSVRLRARQLCMEMRGAESTGEIETFARRGGATRDGAF